MEHNISWRVILCLFILDTVMITTIVFIIRDDNFVLDTVRILLLAFFSSMAMLFNTAMIYTTYEYLTETTYDPDMV